MNKLTRLALVIIAAFVLLPTSIAFGKEAATAPAVVPVEQKTIRLITSPVVEKSEPDSGCSGKMISTKAEVADFVDGRTDKLCGYDIDALSRT
jgi:hypothetical protein